MAVIEKVEGPSPPKKDTDWGKRSGFLEQAWKIGTIEISRAARFLGLLEGEKKEVKKNGSMRKVPAGVGRGCLVQAQQHVSLQMAKVLIQGIGGAEKCPPRIFF